MNAQSTTNAPVINTPDNYSQYIPNSDFLTTNEVEGKTSKETAGGQAKVTATVPGQAETKGDAATVNYPVICYLERRGQTITVRAGPKGALYSARTTDGKVLFENLSGEQLRAQAPDVYRFLNTAEASASGKTAVQDARIRASALR